MDNRTFKQTTDFKPKLPWQWERAWIGLPAIALLLVAYALHGFISPGQGEGGAFGSLQAKPVMTLALVWVAGHSWPRLKQWMPSGAGLFQAETYSAMLFPRHEGYTIQPPEGLNELIPGENHQSDSNSSGGSLSGAISAFGRQQSANANKESEPGVNGIPVNGAFQLYSMPNSR